MADRFCPTCGKKVSELEVSQLERCANCGTPISDLTLCESRNESNAKRRLPLSRLLIALFAPAATALLIIFFYDVVIGYIPWLRNYLFPQIMGFIVMAVGCSIYAAYLLGRGKSELTRIICFTVGCVLAVINLLCVMYAGFTAIFG